MTPRQALRLAALQKRRKSDAHWQRYLECEADYKRPIEHNISDGRLYYDNGQPVREDDPRIDRIRRRESAWHDMRKQVSSGRLTLSPVTWFDV